MRGNRRLLTQPVLFVAAALAIAAPVQAQSQLLVSSATVNLNDNQARSILVTASGTAALTYTVSNIPSWLSVFSSNNFTTPDTLSFQLFSTICGICTAQITLTPGSGSPVTVTVNYTPGGTGGPASLMASPSSLTFSAAAGQSAAPQPVSITTTSPSSITIAGIASDEPWLSASITAGSFAVSATSPATLTVTASALSLTNGTYTGHVTLTPGIGTATTITVVFNVGAGSTGTIVATPGRLIFNSISAQPAAAQNVSLTTASAAPVTIVGITPDVSWLSFSITSGSSTITTTSPATLSVSAFPAGLANGIYTGHITILPNTGSATVITVVLNVGATGSLGTITASQSAFQFTYPGNSLSAPVMIGSNNPAVTTFNVNVTSQSNWLLFQGVAGSFAGLPLGTYNIAVNAAVASTLPTGTYSGVVTLINPQNQGDTTTISLTLTVNAGTVGSLAVTPSTLLFNAVPGGPPQAQNLNVTAPAGASVQLTITSYNGPFFSVTSPLCSGSPNASFSCTFTGSQMLTVAVNPANLTNVGTYGGSLLFQSGSSTVSVPISLVLNGPGSTLTAVPSTLSFTAAAGGAPQTQPVAVNVPGNAPVQLSLTTYNGNFFSVSAGSCVANPLTNPACSLNGSQTLNVTVNPSTLTNPGTYNGIIQLQSGGVSVNVTVRLTLTPGTGGTSAIAAPSALSFFYQTGSNAPPQQLISVGAVQTFSVAATTSTTPTWLVANPVGNIGPSFVVVTVSPQGLAVGTYPGTITVNSSSGIVVIPVTLTVTSAMVVESNPASANLGYQGGAPPPPILQTLNLFASDGSATPVLTSTSTPWITVQSQSSTTTPAAVLLSINPTGLCNGLNAGAVTITAPNAANNGFSIPIVVTVSGSTAAGCSGASGPLMLAPASLTFNFPAGPTTQTLTVTAPSASTSYTVTAGVPNAPPWLSVQPSGTLTGNQTISVSVNPSGLSVGTYIATISFFTNGAVQAVPVTFVVSPPPGITGLTPTPPTLTFTAPSGQSAGSQTVTLTTTNSTPITIFGVSTDSPNFLAASLSGGGSTVSATNPVTLTVTATAARLPVGPFTGNVVVNASTGTLTIPVTLNVTSGSVTGAIVANPSSLTFFAPAGQIVPLPVQVVTLTPATSGPITILGVVSDVTWLSTSLSSATVTPASPALLSVSASAVTLAAGFYVGHITITPSTGAPTIIAVTLLAQPPSGGGTITANPSSFQFVYPGSVTSALVAIGSNNPAITTFNLTFSSQSNWLIFGNNPAGAYSGLQLGSYLLRVDPTVASTLAPGSYPGSITLLNPQNANDTTTIALTLTVNGGTYLAQGKTATQSSTLPGSPTAGASSAVDGNTDGNFYDGSVTATNLDPNPWWQVDLGASVAVNSVVIWNRTDCCGSRLSDYWVFISDTPFLPTDTPATLQNRAGTFAFHETSAPNPSTTIPQFPACLTAVPPCLLPAALPVQLIQGRYLRVQLSGPGYLSLAEVQVFGTSAPLLSNMALGKPATQSSTLPGAPAAVASSAVDGNTDGNFYDGSVTATNLDPNPWWQVDLGVSVQIGSITIWNRTDCCGSRLSDYWVFVSDTPFLATDTPATLQNRPGTYANHQTVAPNPSALVPPPCVVPACTAVVVRGRYVRIQLSSPNYLSLAEVQVFGTVAPTNPDLALGKTSTQSSTLPGAPTAAASSAVDGITDGNFFDGSVTATNLDSNAWWQVDLGSSHTVNSVVVWNRTDCCASRLGDYWVFVSNTPFLATDTPATLQFRPGTFASHQTSAPNPSTPIVVGMQGQYVRVQLSSPNYLSLAEVQVFGQ